MGQNNLIKNHHTQKITRLKDVMNVPKWKYVTNTNIEHDQMMNEIHSHEFPSITLLSIHNSFVINL